MIILVSKPEHPSRSHSPFGFSLVELLIVLLLVSLLAGIAHPTYERLSYYWEMQTTVSAVRQSLQRIKASAITQGAEVILCGSSDTHQCDKNWSQGFITFADVNQNRQRDASEPLLSHHTGLKKPGQLISSERRFFRSWQGGALASQMGSLWYCPPSRLAHLTRRIVVSRIGRIRIEGPQQRPKLTCPNAF